MSELLFSSFIGQTKEPNDAIAGRIFNIFVLFFIINLASYLFLALSTQERQAHAVTLVFLLCIYAAYSITKAYRECSNAMIALNYGHIYYVALITGGVHSSVLCWFAFMPTAALMLGRKSAIFWLWVSIILISSLAVVNYSFPDIQNYRLASQDALWSTIMEVTISLGVLYSIWVYDVLNDQRKSKLEKKTQELNHKHQELQRTQAHKDEFIASVGHELRTPMNAILGFNELLSLEVQSPRAKDIIQNIQTSARQLLKVISDILDYSQLMAGKLSLLKKEQAVGLLLEQAVQRARQQAQGKPLEINLYVTPSTPSMCALDPIRIAQVLDHLLNNAMKFMTAGRVEVTSLGLKDRLRIEVRDNGIGISPEKQKYIFNRFAHANTEINRRYGGTGLGLAICEQLIELHRGKIGVNSVLGRGSTFWFEIPLHEQVSLTEPPVQAAPIQKPPIRYTQTPWPLPYLGKTVQSMYLWFLNNLDKRVPESFRGPKLEAKVGMLFAASFCGPLYMVMSTCPELWVIHALYPSLYLIGLLAMIRGVNAVLIVQSLVALTFVYVSAANLYMGGSHTLTSWLILIPLPAFNLLGRRTGLFWLCVSFVVHFVIYYLTAHQLTPYAWESTPQPIIFYWFSYVHITALVLYLPMHYKVINSKIRKDIELHNLSLEVAQVALIEEQKQKDEFISTVSHEFRTPMNAIIGFNHLLADEIKHEHHALELQTHVTQAADHLLTVIDDILDYSQLRSGNLNIRYEVFNLHQIIQNVHNIFKSKVDRKMIDFKIEVGDIPEWTLGDKHRLTQILINLVGNALKFTEQGFVQLKASTRGDGVLFEISDSGIGISSEKLDVIFHQYEKAHHETHSRFAGHGLGLAISKRLVDLQNGHIRVQSQIHQGSVFTVWLPYQASDAPIEPFKQKINKLHTSEKLHILLVDDHPLNRLLASQMLQKNWPLACIEEAENGFKALQKLRQSHYDVIIMDMVMPEMDGIEATRIIREAFDAPSKDIPIIGLTANINPIEREKCLQAGMNEIIYKPFQMEDLVSTIEGLIKFIKLPQEYLIA